MGFYGYGSIGNWWGSEAMGGNGWVCEACTRTPIAYTTTVMQKCLYYPGVRIKQALRINVSDTYFIDAKTKAYNDDLY